MTTRRSRGISTSIFLRLCTRAPRTAIQSWLMALPRRMALSGPWRWAQTINCNSSVGPMRRGLKGGASVETVGGFGRGDDESAARIEGQADQAGAGDDELRLGIGAY